MDKKSRDILIMKYAPLVKTIVLRMASKLPIDAADKEDLINVGIIGLMSALDKYDDKKNVQFETYAHFRIRGAVLDELRKRDWVPRSTRNKDSRLEEAFAANPYYPCCSFRGSVLKIDLATGAIVWKTYTAPDNGGHPGGYSGNAVWGSEPVVDPARHTIYVGTGNNYTVPSCVADQTCGIDSTNYVDAVLALNMDTGAVVWADPLMGLTADAWNVACFTSIPGTANCPDPAGPDFDFGQGPMKLQANINGKTVDILGIGQKSGKFWGINPDTGQVLWSTQGGPGSALGGMEWGSATDGTRIYYAISNMYGIPYTLKDGSTTTGGLWGALDPATGAILWQTADPNGAMDPGAVSVANGVVYAGSMGNPVGTTGQASTKPTFFALNAATGKILWNYVSGGSVNAGAAIANGMVYWGSGYGHFGLGDPNPMFYAFGLK